MRFAEGVRTQGLDGEDLIQFTLSIFYPDTEIETLAAEEIIELFDAALSFFRLGKEQSKRKSRAVDVLSYEHDAGYIYAAYLKQYGIDLSSQGTALHWWTFRALFDGLGEDEPLMKIMSIRSAELKNYDSKQRGHIRSLQKIYALPKGTDKERERDKEIAEALKQGGDLTGLL
jgi:hypothetical protein